MVKTSEQSKSEESPTVVGGYKATDILKAPLETPSLEEVEDESQIKHPQTKFLLGVSVVLAVLGVCILGLGVTDLGLSLVIVGGIGVVVAVFWNPPEKS